MKEAPGSKQIRISMLVLGFLEGKAQPFESHDSVLRRVLGLPARNQGVKDESSKSGSRKTKRAA